MFFIENAKNKLTCGLKYDKINALIFNFDIKKVRFLYGKA